ncbi:MAG TPA: hypothetical protein PLT47_09340 [Bacteroidales bacterium]|nr:hypothetical protein [Bacteroidales bacterium]HQI70942.1 hypothetical protein [Bacteroidales bacterium]
MKHKYNLKLLLISTADNTQACHGDDEVKTYYAVRPENENNEITCRRGMDACCTFVLSPAMMHPPH